MFYEHNDIWNNLKYNHLYKEGWIVLHCVSQEVSHPCSLPWHIKLTIWDCFTLVYICTGKYPYLHVFSLGLVLGLFPWLVWIWIDGWLKIVCFWRSCSHRYEFVLLDRNNKKTYQNIKGTISLLMGNISECTIKYVQNKT